jgi:sugar O-acyltransferase (sialic acid O-acetyltransferase NeuD family)
VSEIVLVGGFHEIIELAEDSGMTIKGIIDNNTFDGYENFGTDDDIEQFKNKIINYSLVITPDLPQIKEKLHFHYRKYGFKFQNLISKSANISKTATVNKGAVVQIGGNISSMVSIGEFVKINTYANIMHDSIVGDYSTVAPNAVILGNVKIGMRCYIGANATILPNLTICDDVIVGAGCVVTKNITDKGTYIGIPARKLFR